MSNYQVVSFISTINNSQKINKYSFFVACETSLLEIIKILKAEGYIAAFQIFTSGKKKYVEVFLNCRSNVQLKNYFNVISRIRLSISFSNKDIWKFSNKLGIFILNTLKGSLVDKQVKSLRLGGRLLFYVC